MIKMPMNKDLVRYHLKEGKYGMYFYDTSMKIDLTLNMLLDKLNYSERVMSNRLREINRLNIEINDLKNKLTLLKHIYDVR